MVMQSKTTRWSFPFWLMWLALLNAIACALIASYNWPRAVEFTTAAKAFYYIALPSQFLWMAIALALLPFVGHVVFRRDRLTRTLAIVVFGLGMALVVADAKLFELYRFHLNAMVLNLLLGGGLQDNLSFSIGLWLTIVAIVLGLFVLQWLLILTIGRLSWLFRPNQNKRIVLSSVLLFLAANLMHGWHEAAGNTAVTTQVRYVPWFQPLTIKSLLRKLGVDVRSGNDVADINVSRHSALNYPKQPLQCEPTQRYNVLVVMVDSLRFDMLNAEVMPETTAFAEQAIRFDNHYSSGNATRFGVFGFFYGIPSSYWAQMLAEERGSAFVSELVKQQYTVNLLASATLTNPEFDRTAFADVRERIVQAPRKMSIAERDRWVAEGVVQRLAAAGDKPFFTFAFLDAPHGFGLPEGFVSPFQPMIESVNYLELGPDSDRESFFNRYKATALFSDQQIGRVLRAVETNRQLDNTIIIVTSDHGQEFNDLNKNYWGHNSNYSDYQVKVPMLVRWPGKPPAVVSALTAHEDVVPTLMQHLLGCKNDVRDYSTGEDLFAPVSDRALLIESWSDRAILHRDRIYQYTSYGTAEVYDPRYNAQPGEKPDSSVISTVLKKMTTFYQ